MKPIFILLAALGAALLFLPKCSLADEIPYAQAYAEYQAGKPMVVIFSATWCGPCRRLHAALDAIHVRYSVWDIDRPPTNTAVFDQRQIPFVTVWHRGAILGRMRTQAEQSKTFAESSVKQTEAATKATSEAAGKSAEAMATQATQASKNMLDMHREFVATLDKMSDRFFMAINSLNDTMHDMHNTCPAGKVWHEKHDGRPTP